MEKVIFILLVILGCLYRQFYTPTSPTIQPRITVKQMDKELLGISKANTAGPPYRKPTEQEKQTITNVQQLFSNKFQLDLDPEWIHRHLRSSPQLSTLSIARKLFHSNTVPIISKLLMGQYICNHSMSNEEIKNTYDWIHSIGANPSVHHTLSSNAIDILKLSNNPLYTIRADHILREQRQEIIQPPVQDLDLQQVLYAQLRVPRGRTRRRERSLYNDTQTVHNTAINESVLATMKGLQDQYGDQTHLTHEFGKVLNSIDSPHTRSKVSKAYRRLMSDDTCFRHNICLKSAFGHILAHIDQHPHKDELHNRLVEEMSEMSGMCASGHLSRLANTLQGFEDRIRVDPKDEVYAKLSHVVQQRAGEDERLMDLMMDPSSEAFKTAIHEVANDIRPELHKEYNGLSSDVVDRAIEDAVSKYTRTT